MPDETRDRDSDPGVLRSHTYAECLLQPVTILRQLSRFHEVSMVIHSYSQGNSLREVK